MPCDPNLIMTTALRNIVLPPQSGDRRFFEASPSYKKAFPENKQAAVKKYQCGKCDLVMDNKDLLCLHKQQCTITCYMCGYCGKEYKSRQGRDNHKTIVHQKIRPFVCQECGRRFTSKNHLVGHMNVHFDLRPYVCMTCGSAFRYKCSLYMHKKKNCKGRRDIGAI